MTNKELKKLTKVNAFICYLKTMFFKLVYLQRIVDIDDKFIFQILGFIYEVSK